MEIKDIPSRKDYYAREINLNRANELLTLLISKCTFKEINWIYKSLAYDLVSYYDQNTKARLYDGTHTDLNVEQANRLQQQLSSITDLFEQSVIDKREFNEDYLKEYEFARPYLRIITEQKERINSLEEAIKELNSKV